MEINLLKIPFFKMTILSFRDFMKLYRLKNATMNESDLQNLYTYPIYPRDSKKYSNKRFVNKDDRRMAGLI